MECDTVYEKQKQQQPIWRPSPPDMEFIRVYRLNKVQRTAAAEVPGGAEEVHRQRSGIGPALPQYSRCLSQGCFVPVTAETESPEPIECVLVLECVLLLGVHRDQVLVSCPWLQRKKSLQSSERNEGGGGGLDFI